MRPSAATLLPAALLSGALLAGCAHPGPALSPPRAGAPPWISRGTGAFEEGGIRFFAGVGRCTAAPSAASGRAGADPAALREADDGASGAVNAAVDLFFSPVTDPSRIDRSLYLAYLRRHRDFPRQRSMIPRGRVAVVDRWVDPTDGTAWSLARITESDLHLAIGEEDMPEATRQSFREYLATRMPEHVEAWKEAGRTGAP